MHVNETNKEGALIMTTIRLVHALPNAWLPSPGQYLRTKGMTIEEVKEALKGGYIESYIRYESLAAKVSQDTGFDIAANGGNCPSPFESRTPIILCSMSPGETSVKYVCVYDGSFEAADHDWRYSMTEFA